MRRFHCERTRMVLEGAAELVILANESEPRHDATSTALHAAKQV